MTSLRACKFRTPTVTRCNLLAFIFALLTAGFGPELLPQSQTEQNAYDNLPDPRLVTLLKSISGKPGRTDLFPQDGRYLYDLILKNKLASGLEIGASGGYAAIWLGMAFRQTGGRLVSVESSKEPGRGALGSLEQAGLLDKVDLLQDNPFKVIPMLTGPFDFVFLDARKQDYVRYLKLLLPKVRPGGFFVAHDVTDKSRDLADFIRSITGDPHLKTEFVPVSRAGMSVTKKL